ncbi:DUF2231 domain-containing protein [Mycobacterium shigaense]|uniref:Uncharacterized protein n=1 Tax=Mycobacterium shigaense TaxID=722731 RepID=A0A1Z4EBU9_9MYCO|nr:DUF2231 domain-containing protein [Mycobacterium shigaense]MEA1121256.1 DUF2231 domain-containing protein [Mycobacterium shigaense]PRI15405.1 hypothetical protein B2J96_13645 [Mycobacterium shigaense]BAX90416.1 hypothetical protein MSG_00250 [Mycobacterium shigaense]
MSTFNGLPVHILLNHFIVVFAPLTAILAIVCVVWPAARRRLIWLVLLLAVGTLVLTPMTTTAGVWLSARVGRPSPILINHEQLGSTLIYIIAALAGTVALLAALHVRLERGVHVKAALHAAIAVLVVVAAVATLVQTYRVGDSGARAAWGNLTSSAG